ncbi:hypothetical protein MPC1_970002 [Methylocella tundrae]|nr:hypothetical protein MPC1_970002 [Methylocella tundrae]
MLKPGEYHMFSRLHAKTGLQVARNSFEVKVGVILDADGGRAVAWRGEADAS